MIEVGAAKENEKRSHRDAIWPQIIFKVCVEEAMIKLKRKVTKGIKIVVGKL